MLHAARSPAIYSLFQRYERLKEKMHLFDRVDFLLHVYRQLAQNGYSGTPIHTVTVDEVRAASKRRRGSWGWPVASRSQILTYLPTPSLHTDSARGEKHGVSRALLSGAISTLFPGRTLMLGDIHNTLRVRCARPSPPPLQVQDWTQAALKVLFRVCKEPDGFFFGGSAQCPVASLAHHPPPTTNRPTSPVSRGLPKAVAVALANPALGTCRPQPESEASHPPLPLPVAHLAQWLLAP